MVSLLDTNNFYVKKTKFFLSNSCTDYKYIKDIRLKTTLSEPDVSDISKQKTSAKEVKEIFEMFCLESSKLNNWGYEKISFIGDDQFITNSNRCCHPAYVVLYLYHIYDLLYKYILSIIPKSNLCFFDDFMIVYALDDYYILVKSTQNHSMSKTLLGV